MKTLNYKEDIFPYILDCIESEDHNLETPEQKLQYLYDEFKRVAVYPHNLQKFNSNYTAMMADYLQGLPFHFEFENYKILRLAKRWGSIPENATEAQEDKILENYWNFLANNIFKLIRKYKIS